MTNYIVSNITVETSGAFQGNLDMNGNYIKNVETPINSGDAANKYYVDTLVDSTLSNSYFPRGW